MFIPFTFIVVEAQSHGMSQRLANYLVPILNAASVVGRSVPNILSDKLGRFNVMVVMATFTSVVILGLWIPATGNASRITFAILFGIGSGAGIGLTPGLVAQVSDIRDIGVRTGAVFAIAAFAALSGSPIGGRIVGDSDGSFTYAIVFSGVTCAIGAILFGVTRVMLAGVKPVKV